jgi:hypothetical protein
VSCPSVSLCVAADPDDGSFFVSTHPARGASSWRLVALSAFSPAIVSCATQTLCLAFDGNTHRGFASADPTGGAAGWSAAHIFASNVDSAGISCNRSFCMVTDGDEAVVGRPVPLPTPAQLKKALRKRLVPSARVAARLLKRSGYLYSLRIPAAGRLTVSWSTFFARRGIAGRRVRPILIATANAYVGADTTNRIKVRLTHTGRRLLRRSARLTVTAEARFTTAQRTVLPEFRSSFDVIGAENHL